MNVLSRIVRGGIGFTTKTARLPVGLARKTPDPFVSQALKILGETGTNAQNLGLLEKYAGKLVPFVGAGLSIPFGYPSWEALLRQIAEPLGLLGVVAPFLHRREYEEAAQEILKSFPTAFEDTLQTTFDHTRLRRPITTGAVAQLPKIARRFVITTNFDRVLESAFQDAGCPFEAVYPGARIFEATRDIQIDRRILLKLHGDYDERGTRVFTSDDYNREYGSPVDFKRKLPQTLGMALTRPVLFIGCSLLQDRTTDVISEIVSTLTGTWHFALLPESDRGRHSELDKKWHILPLFFPTGDFGRIEAFLKCLAEEISRSAVRKRRTVMKVAVSFLALLAAVVWVGHQRPAIRPANAPASSNSGGLKSVPKTPPAEPARQRAKTAPKREAQSCASEPNVPDLRAIIVKLISPDTLDPKSRVFRGRFQFAAALEGQSADLWHWNPSTPQTFDYGAFDVPVPTQRGVQLHAYVIFRCEEGAWRYSERLSIAK